MVEYDEKVDTGNSSLRPLVAAVGNEAPSDSPLNSERLEVSDVETGLSGCTPIQRSIESNDG